MKTSDLKNNLKEKSKDELIKDILDLFKKNQFVKDFYISKTSDDSNSPIFKKYKHIVENEFFPERGDGNLRLTVAKKAISEFKKMSVNNILIADLMIFYVETGVRYTNEYGDINEKFYMSMERMYEQALKYIFANNLIKQFQNRCLDVVEESSDTGWGFHEQLSEIYKDYFHN